MAASEIEMGDYGELEVFDDLEIELSEADEDDEVTETPNIPSSSSTSRNPESTPTAAASSTINNGSKSRKRKPKAVRKPSEFTLEKAKEQGAALLQHSAEKVANNQFVSATLQHSAPVKQFADTCLDAVQNAPRGMIEKFWTLITLLWPAIAASDKHTTASQRQFAMCQQFHNFWTDKSFVESTRKFLHDITGCENIPHLYPPMFLRALFQRLVILHEEVKVDNTATQRTSLTAIEENALRYTGGYIVSRLPKKTSKFAAADDMANPIKKMTENNDKDTRLNYTKEWVCAQTRGGLVIINDVTFLFFCQLEKLVRVHFPKETDEMRQIDIRSGVHDSAINDERLIQLWDQIIGDTLHEKESLQLMRVVITFYSQVRGFSYARNILEKYKRKVKANQKGQKGLRSGLKRNAQPSTSSA